MGGGGELAITALIITVLLIFAILAKFSYLLNPLLSILIYARYLMLTCKCYFKIYNIKYFFGFYNIRYVLHPDFPRKFELKA